MDGVEYRVHESETGRFRVVRELDGRIMGSFELRGSRWVGPRVHVSGPAEGGNVLKIIGEALSTPRGLLPIQ